MIVLLAISVIYLISALLYPLFGLNKVRLPDVSPQKVTEAEAKSQEEPKPYEFYLKNLNRRQIFTASSFRETPTAAAVASADLIKDLNLVGIISGDNPQAVIEDKKAQKTYYISRGQYVGDFQIEDIQEGKIILNYRGQRYELYM
jgi:type II secretory pathway component PulC